MVSINDIFDQIHAHEPDLNTFSNILEKKFVHHFPQFLTYDVILTPKMTQFWPFSQKMTYFDQMDPINDIFDKIYVHKPDWNNF